MSENLHKNNSNHECGVDGMKMEEKIFACKYPFSFPYLPIQAETNSFDENQQFRENYCQANGEWPHYGR